MNWPLNQRIGTTGAELKLLNELTPRLEPA
jgi:hypothetical protein